MTSRAGAYSYETYSFNLSVEYQLSRLTSRSLAFCYLSIQKQVTPGAGVVHSKKKDEGPPSQQPSTSQVLIPV